MLGCFFMKPWKLIELFPKILFGAVTNSQHQHPTPIIIKLNSIQCQVESCLYLCQTFSHWEQILLYIILFRGTKKKWILDTNESYVLTKPIYLCTIQVVSWAERNWIKRIIFRDSGRICWCLVLFCKGSKVYVTS